MLSSPRRSLSHAIQWIYRTFWNVVYIFNCIFIISQCVCIKVCFLIWLHCFFYHLMRLGCLNVHLCTDFLCVHDEHVTYIFSQEVCLLSVPLPFTEWLGSYVDISLCISKSVPDRLTHFPNKKTSQLFSHYCLHIIFKIKTQWVSPPGWWLQVNSRYKYQ